ncbi:MAG: hypothetical protein KBA28_07990 [Syntrophaceae bacterium]|nr:hypothetical protein [Syntrophaceae bacterium]
MNKTINPVIVRFTGCEYGWIYFTVITDEHEVDIRASEVYDPFPDLIAWLEAIAVGVQECAFDMEEEGPEKRFEFRKISYDKFRLYITDNYEKTLLETFVDRKQLVSAFYNGIKTYASSPDYQEKNRNGRTSFLLERMSSVTDPPTEREVVLRYLLGQKREKIIEVFFKFTFREYAYLPNARLRIVFA